MNNNESKNWVEYLKSNFESSSDEEIINVLNNYKSIEAWPSVLGFNEDNFNKLIDIVKEAKELDKETVVPYDKLVTNSIIDSL